MFCLFFIFVYGITMGATTTKREDETGLHLNAIFQKSYGATGSYGTGTFVILSSLY